MPALNFNYNLDNVDLGDLLIMKVEADGVEVATKNHVVTQDDLENGGGAESIELPEGDYSGVEWNVTISIEVNGIITDLNQKPLDEALSPESNDAIFFDGYQIGVN